ncbi:hypothetical protein BH11VER1_BH11VER1_38820 [soil metagenome]
MKNIIRSFTFLALALMAFNVSAADAPATGAVTCNKCKTVWVSVPVTTPGSKGFVTYRDVKKMECADCESAIVTFFKTGKLQHECKKCGGEMTHCEEHKS